MDGCIIAPLKSFGVSRVQNNNSNKIMPVEVTPGLKVGDDQIRLW